LQLSGGDTKGFLNEKVRIRLLTKGSKDRLLLLRRVDPKEDSGYFSLWGAGLINELGFKEQSGHWGKERSEAKITKMGTALAIV
jgi:hypothetical protein